MNLARAIRLATAAALLCLLVATSSFAQMGQAYEDFGVGPRDAAMGNTGTAAANDFSAAFYNPAALDRAKGLSIHMGYRGIYPRLLMKIGKWDERYFTDYPNTNFFQLGVSWNVVIEKLIDRKYTDRFTFGLALALSDFYKSFAIPYDTDTPYFYRYHDRYLNLLPIYLSGSLRIFDWLSIGGGMVPAPSDSGTDVSVNSNFTVPDYSYNAEQGTITRSYGKLEPVLGVLFRIPNEHRADFFSIGVTWRDEVSSVDGQGVATDYTKVNYEGQIIDLPPSDTPILTLSGWTPMQVIGGMAMVPDDGWVLTGEVLWKRWSNWKNFFIEHPNPRFEDTWNVRVGGEKEFDLDNRVLDAIIARGGGYREQSPVPNQNGQSNYLDPDKWVATAGFETRIQCPRDVFRVPIRAQFAGQAHFMDEVDLHNNQDPDFPRIRAGGEVYSFTFTLGVDTK
jgi:long-subunit fatty acid transport protein